MKSEIIQHISQDLLLRYVEDACSRLEMREIDRHLATCSMCSDAVEGLMLLSAPSVAADNLNRKIDGKIEAWTAEKTLETATEKPTEILAKTPIEAPIKTLSETPVLTPVAPVLTVIKRPFWRQSWAAAAAILLLVSGSFWIFNNAQKAENKAITHTENAELLNLDTIGNSNAPPQYSAEGTAQNAPNDATKNAAKTAAPTGFKTDDKGAVASVSPSGITDVETANEAAYFKDNLGKKQAERVGEKAASNAQKPSAEVAVVDNVATKSAANPPTPTYSTAPANDRTRDYAGASNANSVPRSETVTPAKPKTASASKYEEKDDNIKESESKDKLKEVVVVGATNAKKQGASTPSVSNPSDQILSRADLNFKQKSYEIAAADYAQFINLEPSGDRYERAFFQLATCYMNTNRKADAKVIFQKLVGMNGQYERAAKKALKAL